MRDRIEILICYSHDIEAWSAEHNPDRLPVVQFQTTLGTNYPNNLGGGVLQYPNADGGWSPDPLTIEQQQLILRLAAEIGDVEQ